MKRFLILLATLFCGAVFADTINLHWRNYDGTTYEDSTCVIDSDLILPSTPPTRYGYTFTGWKLANYIPIEYIESTGTQWIDTGLVFDPSVTNAIKGVIEIQFTRHVSTNGSDWTISGISGNKWNLCLSQRKWSDVESIAIDSGTSCGKFELNNMLTNQVYNYSYDINLLNNFVNSSFDNNSKTEYISGKQIPTYSTNHIVLFKCHDGVASNPGIRIYNYKFYFNNTLVRDFIPVLDNNNVPCMFDRVEGKFYYNQGTGQFIAGPIL